MTDPTKIDIDIDIHEVDWDDPFTRTMSGITNHGHMHFRMPVISHITGNLYQGGCENGLVLPEVIKNVVSLYPWENYTIKHQTNSTTFIRMYDSLDQSFEQVEGIAQWVKTLCEDAPTLVHCQAGLNRSSLIAGRTLMLMGYTAEAAIDELRLKRSPACLCNWAFEEYLRGLDG
jgi:protein-tyrosine phosphatase